MTLSDQYIVNVNLKTLQIEDRFTKYHLFYTYLKKAKFKTKQNYFNEFAEYLNHLNMSVLNPYFQTLTQEGFKSNSQEIYHWLNEEKQNIPTFVSLLKGVRQDSLKHKISTYPITK